MDSDRSVVAHYTKIIAKYALGVSVSPPEGGNVSPSEGVYQSGESVTLTATPASGYQFDRWEGDASGSSSSTSVTMDSNKKIVAYFIRAYQRIEYDMPVGSATSFYVFYGKNLEAGEKVEGFVEMSGEYHSQDQFATWSVQIFGPKNEELYGWEGNVASRLRHDFSFTATYPGTYTVRVSHISRFPKQMVIEIQPAGWSYAGHN